MRIDSITSIFLTMAVPSLFLRLHFVKHVGLPPSHVGQVSEGYKNTGVGVYRFRLDRRRDINLMNIDMLT